MGLYDALINSNQRGIDTMMQVGANNPPPASKVTRFLEGLRQGQDRLAQQQLIASKQQSAMANAEAKNQKALVDYVNGGGQWDDPDASSLMLQNLGMDPAKAMQISQGMGQRAILKRQEMTNKLPVQEATAKNLNAQAESTEAFRDPRIAEMEARTKALEHQAQRPFNINIGMVKPPAGYRTTADGNLEAIPGGPADLKLEGAAAQAGSILQGGLSQMDRLKREAARLRNHPGLGGVTGKMGMFPDMPGSEAANARAQFETLKSQVAFNVLQSLREMSKTGGALGQVSDREEQMLANNLAALQGSQSEASLKAALDRIIEFADESKQRMQNAYSSQPAVQRSNPLKTMLTPKAKTNTQTTVRDGKTYYMWPDGNWHTKAPQ